MAHRTVAITHSCGYHEKAHAVELGVHVRHDSSVSVEDHLRVRPCPKCASRGGWTWADTVVHAVASVVAPAKVSKDA